MLKFNMAEVKPLLEHTELAAKHKPCYGNPDTNKPGLLLVKDEGVYLISNGKPAQPNPAYTADPDNTATQLLVCYAEGHDPHKGDTWDADRQECGGDDFVEFIDAATVRKAMDEGNATMFVRFSAKRFIVFFSNKAKHVQDPVAEDYEEQLAAITEEDEQ